MIWLRSRSLPRVLIVRKWLITGISLGAVAAE